MADTLHKLAPGGLYQFNCSTNKNHILAGSSDPFPRTFGDRVDMHGKLFVSGSSLTQLVGVNTTSPMNSVQINHAGADGDQGLMIVRADASTGTGNTLGGIGFDSTDGNVPSNILQASAYIAAYASEPHSGGDKGGELAFGTAALNENDDTTSNEVMRLSDGGDVGIGTDAPSYTLHVKRNDNGVALVEFYNLDTSSGNILRLKTGDVTQAGTKYIDFINGYNNSVGSLVGGSADTLVLNLSSDKRLKTNIRDCEFTIDDLAKVKMRSYTKAGADNQMGVIAQELLNTKLADFVFEGTAGDPTSNIAEDDPDYEYMQVSYTSFIPPLIKSVQDANNMIKELQREIQILKEQVNA